MEDIVKKAKRFIYRNARPIDLARWQYHFEDGTKESVLNALSYYQNEDGGFGNALEADSWNPNSTSIQTWTATQILKEIDLRDNKHPMIQGILRYLGSGKDFKEGRWSGTNITSNDYPHAPWWHTESDSVSHTDYNPTASLAGFIVCYTSKDSKLYELGCTIVKEALDAYNSQGHLSDMHTIRCYIDMLEYCEESQIDDVIDLSGLKSKLLEDVKDSITQNKDEWKTSYICKPSMYFNHQSSIFYKENKEIAEYECNFIVETQLDDGSWSIPWGWSDYPKQWAISENWWKANGIILNLLYLHGLKNKD